MEADNIKQIAEMQTFNDYREPESHSAEDSNGSQFLNCPVYDKAGAPVAENAICVFDRKLGYNCSSSEGRMRRNAYAKARSKFKKVPHCDNPSSPFSVQDSRNEKYVSFYLRTYFKQRKLAKIQEEVYHSKHSENPFKEKAYKEKAASLKTIVHRLKQMCLAKPEVLQNKLPEEVTKLFSNIEI